MVYYSMVEGTELSRSPEDCSHAKRRAPPLCGRFCAQTNQDFRMTFFGNVPSGVVFNDQQLSSSDYSLRLSMSLQNFTSLRCRGKAPKPSICAKLTAWGTAQKNRIDEALVFGMPGPNGGPVQPGAAQ